MLEQTKNRYNSFIGLHEEIHELVWGVNDIYSERIPSSENIENDYNAMANVVNNLMKNYADIEKTKTEIEFESLEESIDSVQASINSQKGKESSAKVDYTSGSILQDNCFNDMLTSIDARKQFLKDNENRIVEFGAFKDEETCALATNDKEYTR